MGLESKEVTFLGFKFKLNEDSGADVPIDEPGQENILFEPQIVQGPKKLDFEYQEFSAEFL